MAKRGRPRGKRYFNQPADWDDHGEVTATVAEVIYRELGRGLPVEMAAQYAGASYATVKDWLVDGRRLVRRQQIEPGFVPTEADAELIDFTMGVSEALAGWVQRANGVLEAMMYNRRRVTTKTVYEIVKAPDGTERLVPIERHVVEVEEPVDATPITWRLSKVMPATYGPVPRYEQESAEGETETIDIAKRVEEVMARIANTLVIAPEESP